MATRRNPLMMNYSIERIDDNTTRIAHGGKEIIVQARYTDVDQAWYNWTMKRYFIQDAFPFLNADQREFIKTGLTPEAWDKIHASLED